MVESLRSKFWTRSPEPPGADEIDSKKRTAPITLPDVDQLIDREKLMEDDEIRPMLSRYITLCDRLQVIIN